MGDMDRLRCVDLGSWTMDVLSVRERIPMDKNASDGVGVTSNKELIRNTIEKLSPSVDSFEQTVEFLKGIYGWKIRVTDKTVTFATADMKKGIRGNKLGEGYGKDELVERIEHTVEERNV